MGRISTIRRAARIGIPIAPTLLAFFLTAPATHGDLVFKEPVANAGIVYTGQPLRHRFSFVNQGSEPAEIHLAKASCGCLAPRLAQRTYRPGEEGTLELEVHTLSQGEGPHVWTVRLHYQSGSQHKETLLELHANVLTEVRVQPAAMVLFADKSAGHEITVTDLRAKPMSILAVRATSPFLKPRMSEPACDREGHWLRKIGLEVTNDYPEGRHEEILTIYTDDPKYVELRVPVTLVRHSQQRLAATPGEVLLSGPPGQPLPSRIVLIHDRENQSVHIDHIMIDDPAITCRWAEGPSKMATLRILVDRTRIHGDSLQSAVHVQVSKPVSETITIPVKCLLK